MITGELKIKIYYEDTDSGGVVYYANYLKFLERARTEMISSLNLSNRKLLDEHKVLIIVKSCKIEYKKPLMLEDLIVVKSKIKSMSKSSFVMEQLIEKMGAPKGTTYEQLDEGQQAHIDAYCEQFDDDGIDHDGGQC